MKKIDEKKSQNEMDELKKEMKLKRKLRSMNRHELSPYIAEILGWAKAEGTSRRKIQNLLKNKMNIQIDEQRIYRFVMLINDGVWPNSRASKNKGEKND